MVLKIFEAALELVAGDHHTPLRVEQKGRHDVLNPAAAERVIASTPSSGRRRSAPGPTTWFKVTVFGIEESGERESGTVQRTSQCRSSMPIGTERPDRSQARFIGANIFQRWLDQPS